MIENLSQTKSSASSTSQGNDEKKGSSTGAQKYLIEKLSRELNWPLLRVQGLMERMFSVSYLDGLNRKQASGLIEALKAIKLRKAA